MRGRKVRMGAEGSENIIGRERVNRKVRIGVGGVRRGNQNTIIKECVKTGCAFLHLF